ncbi:L-2-hydroxyglutarate oxidase [Aeromicrobium sp. A1-2]|uniref:L-2-hydroxyglutarate oxidase n=1 Tax=Aeromicrobium sp. A1-2 TaxID=2107713 RepID=UPI000E4FCD88|nr:L-2-hydroxyglutarate oxidase [Aeromicrobium sp. A1-2]AXT86619.1 L-2-hydroxyglutarate oxidase [Aeromicrobium sp. A1-2]
MTSSDFVVVGAGIIGLAVARELRSRHREATILVIDQADTVAAHQTGHNSGVIHGGIYYEPGSLKARMCVEGARLMYEYCQEHRIPHERCGKLIVALRDDELAGLDALERRGIANGVPGLRRVAQAEIREIEPAATGVAALHAPHTGIVDYGEVSRALHRELVGLGVEFAFGSRVTAIDQTPGRPTVTTADDRIDARRVIVCAGLWADRLARTAGDDPDPRIVPFGGAYLRLRDRERPLVNGMIYPVPDPALPFLGVHVTKHVDGSVMLGPTAMMVPSRDGYRVRTIRPRDAYESLAWPGTWKVARRFWRVGVHEMRMAASRRAFVAEAAGYVPGLQVSDLDGTAHAGVRAQAIGRDGALVDDFVLTGNADVTHVRNAPSPAATSSFALAREIVDRAEQGTT